MGPASEPGRSPVTPPLAPLAHTSALVGVMLAVAITGTLLQHFGTSSAAPRNIATPSNAVIWQQYVPLLLVNGLLVLYVTRLFRPGFVLRALLGRLWRTPAEAFVDLLCATLTFALICVLEVLMRPLSAGRNAAVSALLPSTEAERLTWLLVASGVGFCEEVVYRGYLQTQLGALLKSSAAGITLQAFLFGLAHLEQGIAAALRIGAYGLILGLLARQRASLLPGIACHIGIDLASGLSA